MGKILSAQAIQAILPQRSPYLLLDRVEKVDDTHFTAVKNVSINEGFFCGHFPHHPIMPGVLQLETIRQLGIIAAEGVLAPVPGTTVELSLLERAKFRRPVLPGDRIKVDVELLETSEKQLKLRGSCTTKGGACSEAVMTLVRRPEAGSVSMPQLHNEFDRSETTAMETGKLQELMPHRYPFLLVDHVVSIEGDHIIAVKNVTANEHIFSGGYATLPETLLGEIMAQSGCACVLARPENKGKIAYFMSIDKAEFFRPVLPGDQLVIDIELPPAKSRFGKGTGFIKADGELVCTITLMFALVEA